MSNSPFSGSPVRLSVAGYDEQVDGSRGSDYSPDRPSAAITDHLNVAYVIFFLLGAGTVFPWNAIIGAADFWNKLYGGEVEGYRNYSPMYVFEAAQMLPNFGGTLLMVFCGERLSLNAKLLGGNLLGGVLLLLACVLALRTDDLSTCGLDRKDACAQHINTSFYLVTTGVFLTGATAALVNSGLFGLAAQFPARYTQSVMSGQSLAGVMICVMRIITKAALPSDFGGLRWSSFVYFVSTCCFMIGCAGGYLVLIRLPFVKHTLASSWEGDASVREALLPDLSNTSPFKPTTSEVYGSGSDVINRRRILGKISPFGLVVFSTFCVTLAVFPGVVTSAMPVHTPALAGDAQWFVVIILTLFNVFDLIGRLLAGVALPQSRAPIYVTTVARLVLVPVLVLMAAARISVAGPGNDYLVFVLLSALALTNGYVGSWAMMVAPPHLTPAEREVGGTIMVMLLLSGLAAGSVLANGINPIISALSPAAGNASGF